MTRVKLAPELTFDYDYAAAVERLTGVSTELPLDQLLKPLNHPFEVIDPIKIQIWDAHTEALRAAFTAGLAFGLDPQRMLLTTAEDQA